ncbi:phospholipase B1, membrane-associated-like isoform X2 [Apis laboriosa]|uniref:phospholipase B1, membrane-associated-like isoform X2 n=1 Tax=Apis laboriosa TaxID=183418 RepID=UPI001CC7932C|nr:phospholipase B1, membrane-associated-like isoform X2 [Apis laboriosa]
MMDKLWLFLLLQLLFVLSASQKTNLDSPINLETYRIFRNWILRNFDGKSPIVPDSVHRLRPGDIDVIAAMGDSLTAGIGIFATNLLELSIENRGASFTIGGEKSWRTYLTLPNIFKEFNPRLIGYALGDGQTYESTSQLNVGEINAISRDMPFMAKYLITRMKRDTRIDIKKHWKFISLFIGANDFCSHMCVPSSPWSILEKHRIDLINTFRILRDNLPRTLVSLIIAPNLKEYVITSKKRNLLKCYIVTTIGCSCLFGLQFQDRRQEYYEVMSRWQKLQEEVANYPEFNRKDFTIIVSPGISNIKITLPEGESSDLSYFSADCFHISQKTHAIFANALWNNLLQPIGNKTTTLLPVFETFLCPTSKRPYLVTRENSQI